MFANYEWVVVDLATTSHKYGGYSHPLHHVLESQTALTCHIHQHASIHWALGIYKFFCANADAFFLLRLVDLIRLGGVTL